MIPFPDSIYLGSWAAGVAFTVISTPFWARLAHRFGWLDLPGPRKIHNQPTPLAGGLAIFSSLLLTMLFASLLFIGLRDCEWSEQLQPGAMLHGLKRRLGELLVIFSGGVVILILGWLDDQHDLKPVHKLLVQASVASLVAAAGVKCTIFIPIPAVTFILTVLWIVGVTNAFNLMDNMNGLCAGLAAISSFFFGAYAAIYGQFLTASFAFLLSGTFVGVLPFNFPKAEVFLGNAGSYLAGYLLSVLAILPEFYNQKQPHAIAILAPIFILAIPISDMARVIYVRWRIGHPIFKGDTRHLSHLLVKQGLNQTLAVELIWLFQTAIGLLAFALCK